MLGPDQVASIDAEAVADWIVSHYDGVSTADGPGVRGADPRTQPSAGGLFQGLVIGSSHASASHFALAVGVPWLPASFDVAVRSPLPDDVGPAAVMEQGQRLAALVAAANPDVTVRQIHEPVRRQWPIDRTLTLRISWRRMPAAYRELLTRRLAPGSSVVVNRDLSRWLVVPLGDQCRFQFGTRVGGLDAVDYYQGGEALSFALRAVGNRPGLGSAAGEQPLGPSRPAPDGRFGAGHEDGEGEHAVEPELVDDLRWHLAAAGHRLRQVLYRRPDVLSGAVADLYRRWLRGAGRTGNRLVVECGKLFDPWQVLRAGLVPYWCEYPLASEATVLEWWLAGSAQFSSIDILADPPGMSLPQTAYLAQWESAAAFASRRGVVDPRCSRSYPLGGLPEGHAGAMLAQHPYDLPRLRALQPDEALREMASPDETSGLLVV